MILDLRPTHKNYVQYSFGLNTPNLRLPIVIANSTNIFQSKINQLMDELDYVQAYLDNFLIVTKTFQDHLSKLDTFLQKLHAEIFKVIIEKSTFATTSF
jgi:hypothetical protein